MSMRCPRCESEKSEDFFQNTVRQTRNVGGGDVLAGGAGSFDFDSKFLTCKQCMVRCVSDEEFKQQKWEIELLKMSSEERRLAVSAKAEAEKQKILRKFVEEKGREPLSEWTIAWICIGVAFVIFLVAIQFV